MSECADDKSRIKTLNFNVGVLGHVDSGKTSLARALSSTASTAAFDKNPQSRERGITLDLGFSSFTVDLPDHLRDSGGQQPNDSLQFTLVDCPGHASLIRTIIGGELFTRFWYQISGTDCVITITSKVVSSHQQMSANCLLFLSQQHHLLSRVESLILHHKMCLMSEFNFFNFSNFTPCQCLKFVSRVTCIVQ